MPQRVAEFDQIEVEADELARVVAVQFARDGEIDPDEAQVLRRMEAHRKRASAHAKAMRLGLAVLRCGFGTRRVKTLAFEAATDLPPAA